MDNGEQGGASAAAFTGSTTTAFAALTTILLATGSALYVRAKCAASPLPNTTRTAVASTSATQVKDIVDSREYGEEGNTQYFAMHSESKDSKTPRTKERRRRGKDPVKEIMKGGKKGNKLLLKLSQAVGDMSVPSSAASDIEFADDLTATSSTPGRSRDASVAKSRSSTSSRSASTASSNRSATKSSMNGENAESFDLKSESSRSRKMTITHSSSRSILVHDSTQPQRSSHSPVVSGESSSGHALDMPSPGEGPSPSSSSSVHPISPHAFQQSNFEPITPLHQLSTDPPPGDSPLSESAATPTPPSAFAATTPRPTAPSTNGDAQELFQALQASPSPPSVDSTAHRKPPGFSNQNAPPISSSRSPGSSPLLEPSLYNGNASAFLSTETGGSPYEPSPSCSPPSSLSSVSLTSSSVSNTEDDAVPLTFPTLNTDLPAKGLTNNLLCQPSSSASSSPKPSPKVSALGPTEYIHGKGGTGPGNLNNELLVGNSVGSAGHSRNPRHGHTPHRTPTPSSQSGNNTPPPSLSAQTQIASLRGALEAARLREDKMRLEMEKRSKDLDALRWESVTWRQREAEFQNQILHLTHHLQAYTALYASMSPQGHPPQPLPPGHHLQLPNMNGKSPHLRMSNTPSPAPSPTRLNVAPHVQGNIMLSPMPSPLSQSTHSHMFPYPAMSSPPTPGHPNQTPPSAPPSSSLFSVLFPYAGNQPNAVGGPSRSGRSSVGSMSPDLGAPGSPSQSVYNRGRQRARFWQGSEIDDWIETGGQSQHREVENGAEEELNTVLADAIFKRPDSIRRSSSQQTTGEGGQKEGGEFTFPSLSGFGQAVRSTGTRSPEGSLSHIDDADARPGPEALEQEQAGSSQGGADWNSVADLGRVGEKTVEVIPAEEHAA